ncbi:MULTISPECIES: polysaccharide biosynthesis/export family protein [Hymenobacter]|uniref:Polysaccharide biosynthesis/export family protein n=2 Tax=Hymenobacter TaxID=89966 RepID=A0ABS6X1B6_9BACT|nr:MULTISPECIES: polysaccharide biosynthesis/export family protein [Hymenobacter]MBO3271815.1 polysaccharide biosynthesis/export family protein [Hymenobacter defluvii]MBW3129565.1 polysaccharide biosynthesis/export family protein [Hymenobacter profundi]QNE38678.1 polysaccharide export protein [Hymenobacter sp. NBH84]
MRLPLRSSLLLFLIVWAVSLQSCVVQEKLPYLQSSSYSVKAPVAVSNPRPNYRLQPGDVLSIRVQGADSKLTEPFNITGTQIMNSGDPGTLYLTGYPIGEDGNISLPTVGKLKVQGLDISQAQTLVQKNISNYVLNVNVLVKLLSFKITVLGEVRSPGRYFIYNPQATILEGLGMAGDLTEFGNRENVKLVRQTLNGPEVVLINLTDPKLLQSPYYYLLPNDALYVEPMKARTTRANVGNLALVFAGISSVVLLLGFILK